ncbi:hypothetical protein Dimus_013088 [Dionaea muscipula]
MARSKVRGVEIVFDHLQLAFILGIPENNGICEYIKEEAIIDEATDQGESGSGEKFYDAEDEVQESPEVNEEVPAVPAPSSAQQRETEPAGVDPSGPSGHLPETVMNKL